MDGFLVLRAIGALIVTVGLVVTLAWAMRRFNLSLPSPGAAPQARMLARLPGRRSVYRLTVDGRRYDLLLAPDHTLVLDRGQEGGE